MADIELGGSKKPQQPQKQKMVYMNIPTTIMLMIDIIGCPNCQKYIKALSESIKTSLTNKELRKEIFNMFGVRTQKKMDKFQPVTKEKLTEIFGDIWGE